MVLDRVNKRFPESTTAQISSRSKRIQAGLSTQIIIQVESDFDNKKYTIGAVQEFSYQQSRKIDQFQEIGTDGFIQSAPTSATTHKLSLKRMVFDFQRLPQALQREYRHISNQRRPFNIIVTDYNPYLGSGASNVASDDTNSTGGGGSLANPAASGNIDLAGHKVETVFVNCWFESLNMSFSASDYKIVEDASMVCDHVYDIQSVTTIQGNTDTLERTSNTSKNASIMSAYDSVRTP
jgi:hypothetical protein